MKRVLITLGIFFGAYWMIFLWEGAPDRTLSAQHGLSRVELKSAGLNIPGPRPARHEWPKGSAAQAIITTDNTLAIADEYLHAHGREWNIQPYHELRPEVLKNPLGPVVRFQAYQQGIAILGSSIEILIGMDGEVRSVRNQYKAVEPAELGGEILGAAELDEVFEGRFERLGGDRKPSLVLYVPPIEGVNTPVPAYPLTVRRLGHEAEPVQMLFRATDGQVLGMSRPRTERVLNRP